MDYLSRAFELALSNEKAPGKIYNIGSFYVTWEEIAGMIVEITGSAAGVKTIPLNQWEGPKFLSDSWDISWEKAAQDLGYSPMLSREEGLVSLKKAIAALAERMDGNKE